MVGRLESLIDDDHRRGNVDQMFYAVHVLIIYILYGQLIHLSVKFDALSPE